MWAGIVLAALVVGDLADPQPQRVPCPSPAELAAELARVGAPRVTPPDVVVEDRRMRIVLRAADGTTLGSRDVEAPTSCHERATVAAVLVATWMGIWAEAGPPLPASPPATTASPPPPAPLPRPRAELGVAVTGAHDGNAAALGGTLELKWRLASGLAAFVAASATSERDRRVGPARAGYWRPGLEVGPAVRLGHGRWQGELAAAARLGLLVMQGRDLPLTQRTTHLVPGAAAAIRLVRAGQRWSPFAVLTAVYWFVRQELTIDGQPATAELPGWDAAAGVGCFWAP